MNYKDLNPDLIKRAIASEDTPALANYWSLQYTALFDRKIQYDPEVNKGYINLLEHLTSDRKDLDHDALQQTVGILVRFLDALTIENSNRDVRLSVSRLEEFLEVTDTGAKIGIDYIGSLVSDFAYRASENTAHEKGPYKNFEQNAKDLRPAEFELWADDEDNVKSGLELSRMFDAGSIINSKWTQIPRRNRSILDFPATPDQWRSWSDSYPSSESTTIAVSNPIKVSESSPTEHQDNDDAVVTQSADTENQLSAAYREDSEDQVINVPVELVEQLEPIEQLDIHVIETANDATLEAALGSSKTQSASESTNPAIGLNPTAEDLSIPVDDQAQTQTTSTNVPTYVVGELVKINDAQSEYYGQIFQIVEIEPDDLYRLGGNQEAMYQHLWSVTELQEVDLFDLLDQLNTSVRRSAEQMEISESTPSTRLGIDNPLSMAAGLVVNDRGQVLLTRQNEAESWTLPTASIAVNQIPEQAIVNQLNSQIQAEHHIQDEVGSVMLQYNSLDPSSLNMIYNVFLIKTDSAEIERTEFADPDWKHFQFFELQQLPTATPLLKIALDKYFRHQQVYAQAISHSNLKREEIPTFNETTVAADQLAAIDNHEVHADPHDVKSGTSQTNYILNQLSTPTMSTKYVLKLHQIISTDVFGDITLNLRYNAQGVTAVDLEQAQLTPELQAAVEVILNLVNFMLEKSVHRKEIALKLHLQEGDNSLQINQFLTIIADSIVAAPDKISDMDQNVLE